MAKKEKKTPNLAFGTTLVKTPVREAKSHWEWQKGVERPQKGEGRILVTMPEIHIEHKRTPGRQRQSTPMEQRASGGTTSSPRKVKSPRKKKKKKPVSSTTGEMTAAMKEIEAVMQKKRSGVDAIAPTTESLVTTMDTFPSNVDDGFAPQTHDINLPLMDESELEGAPREIPPRPASGNVLVPLEVAGSQPIGNDSIKCSFQSLPIVFTPHKGHAQPCKVDGPKRTSLAGKEFSFVEMEDHSFVLVPVEEVEGVKVKPLSVNVPESASVLPGDQPAFTPHPSKLF